MLHLVPGLFALGHEPFRVPRGPRIFCLFLELLDFPLVVRIFDRIEDVPVFTQLLLLALEQQVRVQFTVLLDPLGCVFPGLVAEPFELIGVDTAQF